ncbi:phosphotransacetylase family protein, partial [Candidatus Bathyarchaeota archaeon]|nr:phosphotransacetylase family protein [Candidatus Bathyarchaeota archaeon]
MASEIGGCQFLERVKPLASAPVLYIASPFAISGKTNLCLGLALKYLEEGYKVGYFRPIGMESKTLHGTPIDEDVLLMKEVLGLDEPIEKLSPIIYSDMSLRSILAMDPKGLLERILNSYAEVSRNKDLMIVEASRTPGHGCLLGLPPALIAQELKAKAILVSRFDFETVIGDILCIADQFRIFRVPCLGVILNEIRGEFHSSIEDIVKPLFRRRGLELLGALPFDPTITAPTVVEVQEKLSAELLAGQEGLQNIVRNFMIGAMTPESALTFFRKATEKAVITGGDRSDIALAALETSTSALILTGNLYPSTSVLAKAEEKGIPVLLVPYDTYGTVEKIGVL